ncbi:MAG: hypothetical protein AAB152_16200 [Candidatus Coatesbacteria bacterium]
MPEKPSDWVSQKLGECPTEDYMMSSLRDLARVARAERLQVGIFGSVGVAAYLGFFHRRVGDLDIVVSSRQAPRLFKGWRAVRPFEDHKSHYLAEVGKGSAKHTIHVVINGLKMMSRDRKEILGEYSMRHALHGCVQKGIRSCNVADPVRVSVLPIEDLIVTKLLAPVDATTCLDLGILIGACGTGAASGYRRILKANWVARIVFSRIQDLVRVGRLCWARQSRLPWGRVEVQLRGLMDLAQIRARRQRG